MGGRSVPGRYQEGQAAPTPIPEGFTSANTGSHFRENQTSMSKIVLRVKRRKCRQDPARDTNELEQQHAGLGSVQAFSASPRPLCESDSLHSMCCPYLPTPLSILPLPPKRDRKPLLGAGAGLGCVFNTSSLLPVLPGKITGCLGQTLPFVFTGCKNSV